MAALALLCERYFNLISTLVVMVLNKLLIDTSLGGPIVELADKAVRTYSTEHLLNRLWVGLPATATRSPGLATCRGQTTNTARRVLSL